MESPRIGRAPSFFNRIVRHWIDRLIWLYISRHEATRERVVIPRPQVVEAEVGVVLLTPIHELVRRRTADGERVSEGVVFVANCDSPDAADGLPRSNGFRAHAGCPLAVAAQFSDWTGH